jgi:glycosyltransferase involved in cell wall biosynthesis
MSYGVHLGSATRTHANAGTSIAPRVAILCDLAEENWPSMDLVGNMLFRTLRDDHGEEFRVTRVQPTLPYRASGKLARAMGRFVLYPREASRLIGNFDLYHVVDHSYAHLVHRLPAERTIVTCHDLDAFRSLLNPEREQRSLAFQWMAKRILKGLQKAAHVACVSGSTRDSLLSYGLLNPEKLSVVHNGVSQTFSPEPNTAPDQQLSSMLGRGARTVPELLHVGSTIPRKRIDVLLRVFAAVHQQFRECRLLRVGGAFTREQAALAEKLGIAASIDVLPQLHPAVLASAYRRARVTVLTPESEGFGLPVVESLACGTPVVASDIPALREVGGSATRFCTVGDESSFADRILSLMMHPVEHSALLEQAGKFSWSRHAAQMAQIYSKVLAS